MTVAARASLHTRAKELKVISKAERVGLELKALLLRHAGRVGQMSRSMICTLSKIYIHT